MLRRYSTRSVRALKHTHASTSTGASQPMSLQAYAPAGAPPFPTPTPTPTTGTMHLVDPPRPPSQDLRAPPRCAHSAHALDRTLAHHTPAFARHYSPHTHSAGADRRMLQPARVRAPHHALPPRRSLPHARAPRRPSPQPCQPPPLAARAHSHADATHTPSRLELIGLRSCCRGGRRNGGDCGAG